MNKPYADLQTSGGELCGDTPQCRHWGKLSRMFCTSFDERRSCEVELAPYLQEAPVHEREVGNPTVGGVRCIRQVGLVTSCALTLSRAGLKSH
eukprot:COSAG02_NODE_5868_length_3976_cov_2.533918_3_plen_93_part_00